MYLIEHALLKKPSWISTQTLVSQDEIYWAKCTDLHDALVLHSFFDAPIDGAKWEHQRYVVNLEEMLDAEGEGNSYFYWGLIFGYGRLAFLAQRESDQESYVKYGNKALSISKESKLYDFTTIEELVQYVTKHTRKDWGTHKDFYKKRIRCGAPNTGS